MVILLLHLHIRGYPVATLRMSWKKDSDAVGLAGLTPVEAAKGALLCEEFQNMPDPLDVKKEDLFLLVCIVYNVDTVETRVYEEDKEVARIFNQSKDVQ